MRRRLAILADVAEDVRSSMRRARSRRARAHPPGETPAQMREEVSAAEVKRRLDETRARLRSEIPPRQD